MSKTKVLLVLDQGRIWEVYTNVNPKKVDVICTHVDAGCIWKSSVVKDIDSQIEEAEMVAEELRITARDIDQKLRELRQQK